MQLKTFFVQDKFGNAMPGALCYVYEHGTTTLVTTLQDAGGMPLANPVAADSTGAVQVAAPDGVYSVRTVAGVFDRTVSVHFIDHRPAALAMELLELHGSNVDAVASNIPQLEAVAGNVTPLQQVAPHVDTIENVSGYLKTIGQLDIAAQVEQARVDAQAAAAAIGPIHFFDTLAQAQSAASTLTEGDIVEISNDEGQDGVRSRRKFSGGVLVPLLLMDYERISHLNAPNGAERVGTSVVNGVPRSVSDKLGQIVSRDDYDTDAAFAAAGREPTQRLNQIDVYSVTSAGQQMYPGNHGMTMRPTNDNVIGALAISPRGDVSTQRSATALVALFADDIETNPNWRKFSVEMHHDPDSRKRGRLTTRIANTNLKHVDFYYQFGGVNCFYVGNQKNSGNGTNINFSFWPRGYTFGPEIPAWQSGEAVAVGAERSVAFSDVLKLVCTVSGVTGSTEPRPVSTRTTYTDGSVTWRAAIRLTGTSGALPSLWIDGTGNVGFHVIDPAYKIQFGERLALNDGMQFLDKDNTARARVENVYQTNQNLTFGSVPAQSAIEMDVSMAGVIPGDSIVLTPSYNVMQAGLLFNAYVRQNGLVRVMCHNYSAAARTVPEGSFVIVAMRVYQ